MSSHTDALIADALRRYLEAQIRARPAPRAFFRLSDFSLATYISLLNELRVRGQQLAGRHLEVRSIEPIAGHDEIILVL